MSYATPIALALLATAGAAGAQLAAQPEPQAVPQPELQPAPLPMPLPAPPAYGSGRVVALDYAEDQAVAVQGTPGYQVTIEFGGDERIENVAVGDSAAWQVTANKRGDHLFVKALQAGVATNMVVVTDRRLYTFDLVPLAGPVSQMVYTIRFRYPPPAIAAAPVGTVAGRYRLSGDRAIRPAAISDDGTHTAMQWPANVALPAVYTLDAEGRETLANGAMRDGTYVIDGIAARLVFRRDRRVAYARRLTAKAP